MSGSTRSHSTARMCRTRNTGLGRRSQARSRQGGLELCRHVHGLAAEPQPPRAAHLGVQCGEAGVALGTGKAMAAAEDLASAGGEGLCVPRHSLQLNALVGRRWGAADREAAAGGGGGGGGAERDGTGGAGRTSWAGRCGAEGRTGAAEEGADEPGRDS